MLYSLKDGIFDQKLYKVSEKNSPNALTAIYLSELGFMNSQDEFCYKISHLYFYVEIQSKAKTLRNYPDIDNKNLLH